MLPLGRPTKFDREIKYEIFQAYLPVFRENGYRTYKFLQNRIKFGSTLKYDMLYLTRLQRLQFIPQWEGCRHNDLIEKENTIKKSDTKSNEKMDEQCAETEMDNLSFDSIESDSSVLNDLVCGSRLIFQLFRGIVLNLKENCIIVY